MTPRRASSGERAIYVVDTAGQLTAHDRADGRRLWTLLETGYVGAPAALGDEVVAAEASGAVVRLGPDGARRGAWTTPRLGAATGGAGLAVGPLAGGGALWLGDRAGVLWRLGPRGGGPETLAAAWSIDNATPPFAGRLGDGLYHSPAPVGGRAVVVDSGGAIYLVDLATGAAERRGALAVPGRLHLTDPVVAGDVLLAVAGDALYAADLRAGQARWSNAGAGAPTRPPDVEGGGNRALGDRQPGALARDVPHARRRHRRGALGGRARGRRRRRGGAGRRRLPRDAAGGIRPGDRPRALARPPTSAPCSRSRWSGRSGSR